MATNVHQKHRLKTDLGFKSDVPASFDRGSWRCGQSIMGADG